MPTTEIHPTDTDLQLQVGFLIHDLSRLKRKAFDKYIKDLKVTRSQWWVLAYVARRDGLAQTQLADQLDVGKVAIGGLIDRLERSGLAERVADEEDRRVKRIFLTPKGRQLVSQLREVSVYFNQRVLEGVSDPDLAITAAALRKMKTNLVHFLGPRAGKVSGVPSLAALPKPIPGVRSARASTRRRA